MSQDRLVGGRESGGSKLHYLVFGITLENLNGGI